MADANLNRAAEMDKSPQRVCRSAFPELTRFPQMPAAKFSEILRLKENISVVLLGSQRYILKKHTTCPQDLIFRKELEAYVLHNFKSLHIIDFAGYTVDNDDKIDAMVLQFSSNYDMRFYIRENRPED